MKKMLLCLLLLLTVSGCGVGSTKQKQTSSETTGKSIVTKTKVTRKQSSSQVSQNATERIHTTMNLDEIGQSFFSSLLGDWQEVAVSVNHLDGKGSVWEAPNPQDQLTITTTKVANREIVLALGSITDNNKDSGLVEFEKKNGYLQATAAVGAHQRVLAFYPCNVLFEKDNQELPATINTAKERITVWVGDQPYLQVFERKTTAPNAGFVQSTMNQDEALAGNYTSLKGSWQNSEGKCIKVSDRTMQFSDLDLAKQATSGTVAGLDMNVPSLNNENGQPKTIALDSNRTVPRYLKTLKLVSDKWKRHPQTGSTRSRK
jgi:hypothetical protein